MKKAQTREITLFPTMLFMVQCDFLHPKFIVLHGKMFIKTQTLSNVHFPMIFSVIKTTTKCDWIIFQWALDKPLRFMLFRPFLVDQAHCSMFEFMVVVNHHNCEEVVVLFLWDIPYGITEITSLWLSTDLDHLLSWSGLHTMPHLVTHHFWMTSHLADLFPSSKKCISSLSYFLQILHQPLVSLFPS